MSEKQWVVWEGAEVHVAPDNDAVEHDLQSLYCVCGPEVDFTAQKPVVIHVSLDGREQHEVSA